MAVAPLPVVLAFILLGALLYTSVGHGGATVYLAVLTLAGYHVGELVTTILLLNILAASIAFANFQQAGHLRWRLLVPFVITSIPAAYFGGSIDLSGRTQELILGIALLAGAARLLLMPKPPQMARVPREGIFFTIGAPVLGAALGFLAGATGIGGGIFLSPILLLVGWANVQEAGAVASAFIVLNSIAGFVAKVQTAPVDFVLLLPLSATVLAGAIVGSFAGARRLTPRALQALLGVVLLVAGAKALLAV